MLWKFVSGVAALTTLAVGVSPTVARAEETTRPVIPRCAQPLGAITIVDGDRSGWTVYDLQSPQKLLKLYVQQSGCFTLVDRGAGFDAAQRERDLEKQGDLQRRSNVGGGQVRAADYVLVAEVVAADRDTGGSAVGGIIGGIVGGPIGGAIGGGLRTRDLEAQAILSLTDVRTSVRDKIACASRSRVRNPPPIAPPIGPPTMPPMMPPTADPPVSRSAATTSATST